jgi:hypothetical protein
LAKDRLRISALIFRSASYICTIKKRNHPERGCQKHSMLFLSEGCANTPFYLTKDSKNAIPMPIYDNHIKMAFWQKKFLMGLIFTENDYKNLNCCVSDIFTGVVDSIVIYIYICKLIIYS